MEETWYSVRHLERDNDGIIQSKVVAGKDSPWFDGHFPRQPILPGIAQLSIVNDLILKFNSSFKLSGITRVKFKEPILPDTILAISIVHNEDMNSYKFTIKTDEVTASSGMLQSHHKEK